MATGKSKIVRYGGRALRLYNQRSEKWTEPYGYIDVNSSTLHQSGCGVFSLSQAIEWMTGRRISPAVLADFALRSGGRGDDGTDRPALLSALQKSGKAKKWGFSYHFDGLRNDLDALYEHLANQKGAALCNLRVGHIVALIGAAEINGEKCVLALDCYSESADERVRDQVAACVPGSEINWDEINAMGIKMGEGKAFSLYFARLQTARDFNLLYILGE